MTQLELIVTDCTPETPRIVRLTLMRASGATLPDFDAGSHLTFSIPGIGLRNYSLIHAGPGEAAHQPRFYTIGVLREENGGGGSLWMSARKAGDHIAATGPQNNFPLKAGNGPVLLVAGGIGVTPLLSMAAALKAQRRPFRFIYAAQSPADHAFMTEARSLAGDALEVHSDMVAGGVLDLAALFSTAAPAEAVYICGPKPMLKAAMAAARTLGWPRDRLSFELFYSLGTTAPAGDVPPDDASPARLGTTTPAQAGPLAGAATFEIELRHSGRVLAVPTDKSILDVLIDAGTDPMFDCRRGECGVCQVGVIDGVPDHRDVILSVKERADNKVIQTCVSRAKSARLVLNL